MNIAYKRINKSAGNYEVLLDEKNVGIIIGQTRKWELKNLFGTIISKGITRDLAVKNALDNLWEYEMEFELFRDQKKNQDIVQEELDEVPEENNISYSEPKLGDDYQPMEKESNLNKCTRIINNSLTKIREYANKIGIY